MTRAWKSGQTAWKSGRWAGVSARAAQPVADGVAGGLRAGDPLIEFRELALRELAPVGGALARRDQGPLLGQSEPGVALQPDGGDDRDRRFRIAALPGNPRRRGQEAELLVVAQRRGGDPGAPGQFADRQRFAGRLDLGALQGLDCRPWEQDMGEDATGGRAGGHGGGRALGTAGGRHRRPRPGPRRHRPGPSSSGRGRERDRLEMAGVRPTGRATTGRRTARPQPTDLVSRRLRPGRALAHWPAPGPATCMASITPQ